MSLRPGPLISKRRDEPSFLSGSQVAVGVGWLHIGQNYTVISNEPATYFDSGWSNGAPNGLDWPTFIYQPDGSTVYDGRDTQRTTSVIKSASATLELVVTVGTRSGETWRRARHTLNFNGTSSQYGGKNYTWVNGIGAVETPLPVPASTNSDNFDAKIWYGLFPAGDTDILLVVSIIQFNRDGWDLQSVTIQNTKQISLLITETNITEVTHPLPVYVQKDIDSYLAQAFASRNIELIATYNPARTAQVPSSSIGIYQSRGALHSSAMFEGIAQNGDFISVLAQQAKSSYAAFSGKTEIPVLHYKPNDPLAASTPTTEEGLFGIIPGASVTEPITSGMLAAGLDDELEQRPGPNAENQPEPTELVVAYDYHGGTYCRSRLAALGITLP